MKETKTIELVKEKEKVLNVEELKKFFKNCDLELIKVNKKIILDNNKMKLVVTITGAANDIRDLIKYNDNEIKLH